MKKIILAVLFIVAVLGFAFGVQQVRILASITPKPTVMTFYVNLSPKEMWEMYHLEILNPAHSAIRLNQKNTEWEKKYKYIHIPVPNECASFNFAEYQNKHAGENATEAKPVKNIFIIFSQTPDPDQEFLSPLKH